MLFIVHGFRFLSILCLAGRGEWTIRCIWPGVVKARFDVGTCPDLWFFDPRGWRRGVVGVANSRFPEMQKFVVTDECRPGEGGV